MSNKKILIVTQAFYPDQSPRSFRATELAKELCRQGHDVTVMAPEKENLQSLLSEFPIHFISMGKLKWKIPTLNGNSKIAAVFNKFTRRLFPLLLAFPEMEMFFMVRRILKNEKHLYDKLISIAVPYPIHWGVASIWSKNKAKNVAPTWIADCGDPYCLQQNDTFQPPFYFHWIEKWFMRKADIITVPTKNSYKGYFEEFHSKISVIPQGFKFADIKKLPVNTDGIIRFGYGGAFIPGRRDPSELLEYLCKLDNSIPYEFHIFTSTNGLVIPFANRDSRIKLHSPITRNELLSRLSTFQFVVNFANVGTAQTPSKLIDYAIIEKPILHVETGNIDIDKVERFLRGDYDGQLLIEDPERYHIENVAQQFLNLK